MSNGITPRDLADTRLPWWGRATAIWSLLFAAPHFYWAVGGRAGLGTDTQAADQAFGQSWFFAYNLLVGLMAVAGAVVAIALAHSRRANASPWLRLVAWMACGLLCVRGAIGLVDLALQLAAGDMDSPVVLVVIEPWFLLGGVLFGVLAIASGRISRS